MKRFDARGFQLAAVLLSLTAGGCNLDSSEVDNLPKVAVSGRVTLDGKPLPEGKIEFRPQPSSAGTMVVGAIQDGAFSIAEVNGPLPGKYRVIISSVPVFAIKRDAIHGSLPGPATEKVPSQYSEMPSDIEAEVKAPGPILFEFKLGKKP